MSNFCLMYQFSTRALNWVEFVRRDTKICYTASRTNRILRALHPGFTLSWHFNKFIHNQSMCFINLGSNFREVKVPDSTIPKSFSSPLYNLQNLQYRYYYTIHTSLMKMRKSLWNCVKKNFTSAARFVRRVWRLLLQSLSMFKHHRRIFKARSVPSSAFLS